MIKKISNSFLNQINKLKITNFFCFDHFILGLIFVFSWWLMSSTFGFKDGDFVIASKLWSDFGAHIPLMRSFSMGMNLPPEYPQFPLEPIRYHYLFYAFAGWLELLGIRLDVALNLISALGMSLLLWMLYRIVVLVSNSKKLAVAAMLLCITNPSLSWLQFISQHLQKQQLSTFAAAIQYWWQAIVSQQNFVAFGPWDGGLISAFWTLNIFTNQRHLAFSFGLVLWLLWPLLATIYTDESFKLSKSKSLLIVLMMTLFPLIHQAGIVVLVGAIIGLLIWHWRVFLKNPKIFFLYVLAIILAVISFKLLVPASKELLTVHYWFLAKNSSFEAVARYWLSNLGLYLPLLFVLLAWPSRGRVFAWLALGLLVVTNIWQLSPDMINNHKLVNFALIFLIISTTSLFGKWWQLLNKKITVTGKICGYFGKFGIITALLFLMLGGVIDFFPILNDRKLYLPDWQKVPVAIWIKLHTPPQSVILPTDFFYHPTNLVGRKIFVDYGYFAWSLGYQDRKRRDLLPALFGKFDSISQWCDYYQKHKIDYVVISPQTKALDEVAVIADSFVVKSLQPTVKTSDKYTIYSVKEKCLR